MCEKLEKQVDSLKGLWGRFNVLAQNPDSINVHTLNQLVSDGKGMVQNFQTLNKVAGALIKAAELDGILKKRFYDCEMPCG